MRVASEDLSNLPVRGCACVFGGKFRSVGKFFQFLLRVEERKFVGVEKGVGEVGVWSPVGVVKVTRLQFRNRLQQLRCGRVESHKYRELDYVDGPQG